MTITRWADVPDDSRACYVCTPEHPPEYPVGCQAAVPWRSIARELGIRGLYLHCSRNPDPGADLCWQHAAAAKRAAASAGEGYQETSAAGTAALRGSESDCGHVPSEGGE